MLKCYFRCRHMNNESFSLFLLCVDQDLHFICIEFKHKKKVMSGFAFEQPSGGFVFDNCRR